VAILGGGSNVVVSDRGFRGLVLMYEDAGLRVLHEGEEHWLLRCAAGRSWDDLVQWTIAHELQGLECLSGIPGRVGAAPIQNIGAYGQELAEVLSAVEVLDLETGEISTIDKEHCGFGYRDSRFKGPDRARHLILGVDLELRRGSPPVPRYPALLDELRALDRPHPSLAEVRDAVLRIRRRKSMLGDEQDPNGRSCGSFFTNPIVDAQAADEIEQWARGNEPASLPMPRYPADRHRVKLSAAWLIERAGLRRGERLGRAGISTAHILALINRGGATAADMLALARRVQTAVFERFGLRLRPEPVPLGFEPGEVDDLWGD
jgi:UDP-N-acetylmuramate dehydrogenase